MSFRGLPRDIVEFLSNYPDQTGRKPDLSLDENLRFYSNELKCQPDNLLIDDMHSKWTGEFYVLERKHGYIQWLFPIREFGMNWDSQPLQLHEIKLMKANPEVMKRVLGSYKLMLEFYGMELVDEETGLLKRAELYQPCYRNLAQSPHNNLRISRILKCLSELGLEHLNAGLLLHILNEQCSNNELNTRTIRDSMDRFWVNCIRNEHERNWINGLVAEVRKGNVDFDRKDYERVLAIRRDEGKISWKPKKAPKENAEVEERQVEQLEPAAAEVTQAPSPSTTPEETVDTIKLAASEPTSDVSEITAPSATKVEDLQDENMEDEEEWDRVDRESAASSSRSDSPVLIPTPDGQPQAEATSSSKLDEHVESAKSGPPKSE